MATVTLRKGLKEDIPTFHKLYKKLIEHENPSKDNNITEEDLMKYAYKESPFLEFILAEVQNEEGVTEAVGFTMYFYVFSTFGGRSIYMEALYVEPEHQRKSIGKQLWKNVVQIGLENDCERCIFNAFGNNANAVNFYKKHGAMDMTTQLDDHIFHMDKNAMVNFASS